MENESKIMAHSAHSHLQYADCYTAWNLKLPTPIQAALGRDMLLKEWLGNTTPLRLDPSTNCTVFLEMPRSNKRSAYNWGANDALVYPFGLNEERFPSSVFATNLR
jgi:hypothetical protein